jgi:hypothetical protein
MVALGQFYDHHTLTAVNDTARSVSPEIAEAGDHALQRLPTGPYSSFAKQLVPAVMNATVKSTRCQTWIDAARVACALVPYRLANRQLPESLEALVPPFLSRLPTDVITGQPLRFRRTSLDDYAVYSAGWNKTDEGGKRGHSRGQNANARTGDWVRDTPPRIASARDWTPWARTAGPGVATAAIRRRSRRAHRRPPSPALGRFSSMPNY